MSGYLIAAGIIVLFLAGAVVFLVEVRNAVEGWEDGDGFHYGTEPGEGVWTGAGSADDFEVDGSREWVSEWWPVRIDDERND